MAVIRLKTRRDTREQATLETVAGLLQTVVNAAPSPVADRALAIIERGLAARSGWSFIMVEPRLYADVIAHLRHHSGRPLVAMDLFTRLFSYLPPDGNEVRATRDELARVVGCSPRDVSRVMAELEAVGAVYRRRDGRGVRYFVNPRLGTHLAGATRDRAQSEAPPLKLRLVEPAE